MRLCSAVDGGRQSRGVEAPVRYSIFAVPGMATVTAADGVELDSQRGAPSSSFSASSQSSNSPP